jgi:hypothetical protein
MFKYVVYKDYSTVKIRKSFRNADLKYSLRRTPKNDVYEYVINYSYEYKMTGVIFLLCRTKLYYKGVPIF